MSLRSHAEWVAFYTDQLPRLRAELAVQESRAREDPADWRAEVVASARQDVAACQRALKLHQRKI